MAADVLDLTRKAEMRWEKAKSVAEERARRNIESRYQNQLLSETDYQKKLADETEKQLNLQADIFVHQFREEAQALSERNTRIKDTLSGVTRSTQADTNRQVAFGEKRIITLRARKKSETVLTPEGQNLKNQIETAGTYDVNKEEIRELSDLYPNLDLRGNNLATASHLAALGVLPNQMADAIEDANLTPEEQDYFTNLTNIAGIIQGEHPELIPYPYDSDLEIVVEKAPDNFQTTNYQPTPSSVSVQSSGNIFDPLIEKGKAKLTAPLKDKFKSSLKTAGEKLGIKGAEKIGAEKAAAKIAGSKLANFIGLIPGVGPLLSAIGKVLAPFIGEFVARHTKDIRDALGASIAVGGLALTALGGLVILAITTFVASLVIPLIIVFVGIPLFIAFSMYIINNGAWVVPVGSDVQYIEDSTIDSAYIQVNKTVSPQTASNQDLANSLQAHYTVVIEAELGTLSNITFDDICNGLQAGTPPQNIACPPATNIEINGVSSNTFPPLPPETLSPGTLITITFDKFFAPIFANSRITDTFTVTANVEGLTGEQSASTAVLIIGNPPGPGECSEFGPDITNSFASRIPNGNIHLLPLSTRYEDQCIVPTILAMHWSAGTNDDPNGNNATWNSLASSPFSCQFGTDTNDAQIWQALYQNGVERPACVGGQTPDGTWWNDLVVNIEMAGTYFTGTPPPPNLDQLEITYQTACAIMNQWDIPWTQIKGHYEMTSGKSDPGQEFLENVFLPEIRNRCPNN